MTTDFRALCAELHAAFTTYAVDECHHNLLERAHATLAEAVPEGREPASVTEQPSNADLLKLAQQYSVVYLLSDGSAFHPFQEGYDMRNDVLNFARAVLARWGRPVPAPVPVSERLPEPEDCDAEGRCWWWHPSHPEGGYLEGWMLRPRFWGVGHYDLDDRLTHTHWIPAHAIQIPTAND